MYLATQDSTYSKVNRPNLGHVLIWDTLNKSVNRRAQKKRTILLRTSNCTLAPASFEDVNDYVVVCISSAQLAVDPPWVVLEEYHSVT